MEQKNNSRILHILKLLYEQTDDDHQATTTDIINYLAEHGICAHRKTIPGDIELLQEFGFDIIAIKSSQNKYFIGTRQFELPELKLLIDAVESSKFITAKKSEQLISKFLISLSTQIFYFTVWILSLYLFVYNCINN